MLLMSSLDDACVYFERVSGPALMFAVSGERKVFKDRYVLVSIQIMVLILHFFSDHAFRLFLQKEGGQMLFSNGSADVEAFIREHVCL